MIINPITEFTYEGKEYSIQLTHKDLNALENKGFSFFNVLQTLQSDPDKYPFNLMATLLAHCLRKGGNSTPNLENVLAAKMGGMGAELWDLEDLQAEVNQADAVLSEAGKDATEEQKQALTDAVEVLKEYTQKNEEIAGEYSRECRELIQNATEVFMQAYPKTEAAGKKKPPIKKK